MDIEIQIVGLLIIAVWVSVAARRARIPYTVAMVLTGLGVSFLRMGALITDLALEPHLIFITFLPGLLFEAAYHLDLTELRKTIRTILILAIPGTLLSMTIIGLLLNQLLDLPLAQAMVFGILISATDPVAVVAIFKELGVPRRLNVLIEGESLFNDGVAIVLYTILVGVATGEQTFNLGNSFATFLVTVAGGAAVGFAAGVITSYLMRITRDHVLDIALTAILAYGTYLFAADFLHEAVSPVIAVVVAAITVGNNRNDIRYASSTLTIVPFWEFVAFIINSAIFLLIGMTVIPRGFVIYWREVLIGIGVILGARAVVVYSLRWIADKLVHPLPLRWTHIIFWGGLRGAVSLALALSLPSLLPSRTLLITMAFGYVLFSLIVQGMTLQPLMKLLGLTHVSEHQQEYELHRARFSMAGSALKSIDDLHEEHILSGQVWETLREAFNNRRDEAWEKIQHLLAQDPTLAEVDIRYIQEEIIGSQKLTLRSMLQRGILSDQTVLELAEEADRLLSLVDHHDGDPMQAFIHRLPLLASEEDIIDRMRDKPS